MRILAAARAAARAREKISSRRSSSLAATDVWKKKGMILESKAESEKSLYLRFFEKIQGVNRVVGPINLSLKNSYSDDGNEEEYLSECEVNKGISRKSQILFPFGGTTAKNSWHFAAAQFAGLQFDAILGKLNGKHYCFDDTCSSPFKVKNKGDEWQPLANPPFTKSRLWGPGYISVLEGSNKMLAWEHKSTAVYCFDVTNPENGWIESSTSLANTLPFLAVFDRPPTFIHHPPFYLIFNGQPYDLLISAFFMSHDCHSVRVIQNGPIQLMPQQYCSKYIQEYFRNEFVLIDHHIIHLGGQQACLILNRFLSDQKHRRSPPPNI